MMILLTIAHLIIGSMLLVGCCRDRLYIHGKRAMFEKHYLGTEKRCSLAFSMTGMFLLMLSLMSNVYLQFKLASLFGERISIIMTVTFSMVMFIPYWALSKVMLQHGRILAMKEYFEIDETFYKFLEDAKKYRLELGEKFEDGIREVYWLFDDIKNPNPDSEKEEEQKYEAIVQIKHPKKKNHHKNKKINNSVPPIQVPALPLYEQQNG